MEVYKISAVTLAVANMEKSCSLYSKIPGFRLEYGGGPVDTFTTFRVGDSHLNLELRNKNDDASLKQRMDFGRIIFHADDLDGLYSYLRNDGGISGFISFENPPQDASWGERFFHVRDPDGYQLSFAKPIKPA